MRKASREMDAAFALEVLDKAPYVTEPPVGKRKQYDKQGEEMKYGRMK